ncbi:sodium:proton antiporter [Campylobacter lari]|uniref:phosphoribosyltransferase family protein n=1 Tax=unclassified Campylobacter TaxID=2593542 RepID=UPI0012787C28|nr:phosphoribosyltransferase family protein [Campylobacter sp. FU_497]EAJ6143242.1 sodium:proton antiporter [Campylobacter lari]MCR8712692.1 phosphoribosyltransferase family protein [Campylobacter sp. W0066.1]EAK0823727.1 sodium:proton antiporter [Campylobacter lari]EAL5740969.1 sodium:proton antiporter [Campylobacter lari]EGK7514937.1 sodium:proton antiporter [Campylobacter lari]
MLFEDEKDALARLYDILPLNKLKDYIIITPSLKSIIFVDALAQKLEIPYDFLFTEQIKAPNNDECQIAMISETKELVYNEALVKAFDISLDYIYGEANRTYEEKILKNVYRYRKGNLLKDLKGKNILMLHEGCESGITASSCIKSLLKEEVNSIIYATALMPSDVYDYISVFVDEVYCVQKIDHFVNIEFYFKNKTILQAYEILDILEESKYYLPLKK